MPKYKLTDAVTGKVVTISGDSEPTQSEAEQIFVDAGLRKNAKPSFSTSEMVSNIPSSAANYGKAIAQPVIAPVETGTSLANLASGAITKAASKVLPVPEERLQEPDVKTFDAAKQALIDRYGSWDQFTQTLQKDPVGTLADISTVLGGGSAALKAGGLAKAAKVAQMASTITEPVNLVMAPVKAGLKAVAATSLPEKMYASSVKQQFSKKKGLERFVEEGKAGLEAGILPNEKGLNKLDDIVANVENAQAKAVSDAGGASRYISTKEDALKYIPDEIEKIRINNRLPSQDVKIVQKAADDFLSEHGNFMDLNDAVNRYKGIYQELKGKYGKQTTPPIVKINALKSIARGLKDSVFDAIIEHNPQLKVLKEQEGALLGLRGAIEQGALRIAKRDIIGIGSPVKVGAGAALGGTPGALVGAIVSILDMPVTKARLAIALKTASKRSAMGKYGTARLAAYQAGRGTATQGE